MFGYVRILKDELKIKDYNTYKAYYCGLCHSLGKRHGQLCRLGLNYDLTFMAIVLDSLADIQTEFQNIGCVGHVGKRKTVVQNASVDYAADMNIILAYYKLKDDIIDNHSIKAALAIVPFAIKMQKLKRKYSEICQRVEISLKRLAFLEQSGSDSVSRNADEFASLMSALFDGNGEDVDCFVRRLGKFIYSADAYDDMNDDFKTHKYNPAVLQYGYNGTLNPDMAKAVSDNLYFLLGDIAQSYEKLHFNKNKTIIDNIIYLGMRSISDRISTERINPDEKSI